MDERPSDGLSEIQNLYTTLSNYHGQFRALGFRNCSPGYRHEFFTRFRESAHSSKRCLTLSDMLSPENQRFYKVPLEDVGTNFNLRVAVLRNLLDNRELDPI